MGREEGSRFRRHIWRNFLGRTYPVSVKCSSVAVTEPWLPARWISPENILELQLYWANAWHDFPQGNYAHSVFAQWNNQKPNGLTTYIEHEELSNYLHHGRIWQVEQVTYSLGFDFGLPHKLEMQIHHHQMSWVVDFLLGQTAPRVSGIFMKSSSTKMPLWPTLESPCQAVKYATSWFLHRPWNTDKLYNIKLQAT